MKRAALALVLAAIPAPVIAQTPAVNPYKDGTPGVTGFRGEVLAEALLRLGLKTLRGPTQKRVAADNSAAHGMPWTISLSLRLGNYTATTFPAFLAGSCRGCYFRH